MKYFFDPAVGVRAFESDGSQDFLITAGMRAMPADEVHAHCNPPVVITHNRIAARRYEAEVGGITLDGMQIDTDDRSKLLINGAALGATIDPAYVMQWKTPGGFVELTGEQVIGIARAVRAHVQACFDREGELHAALEAGTLTAAMLDEGWPQSQPAQPETTS